MVDLRPLESFLVVLYPLKCPPFCFLNIQLLYCIWNRIETTVIVETLSWASFQHSLFFHDFYENNFDSHKKWIIRPSGFLKFLTAAKCSMDPRLLVKFTHCLCDLLPHTCFPVNHTLHTLLSNIHNPMRIIHHLHYKLIHTIDLPACKETTVQMLSSCKWRVYCDLIGACQFLPCQSSQQFIS